jgi:AcrR family transcriptional regulator
MGEILGLRQRKKRTTRQALASAALRLAAERGPERVTVDAISQAAGVSPRTFFNYFATKEEAIVGADPEAGPELRARLEARPSDEAPLEALEKVLVAESEALEETMDEWAARIRLVREFPALFPVYVARFASVERVLVEAVAARTGLDADADLYPSIVVGAALTSMRHAVDHWQATGRATPLPVLLDDAFRHLRHGCAPPRAQPGTRSHPVRTVRR